MSEPDYELLVRVFLDIHGLELWDRKLSWRHWEDSDGPRWAAMLAGGSSAIVDGRTFHELYEELLTYAPAKQA